MSNADARPGLFSGPTVVPFYICDDAVRVPREVQGLKYEVSAEALGPRRLRLPQWAALLLEIAQRVEGQQDGHQRPFAGRIDSINRDTGEVTVEPLAGEIVPGAATLVDVYEVSE